MNGMPSNSRWRAVADAIETRRISLGISRAELSRRAKVSDTKLREILNAEKDAYRDVTLTRIARGLEWPPDAIHRILAGDDPDDFPPDAAPSSAQVERRPSEDDEVLRIAAKSGRLSAAQRAALEIIIDGMLDE